MADLVITAASFIPSATAKLIPVTFGEAVTRGQAIRYDSSAGTHKLFDADDTSKDEFAGLACEDAAAGQQGFIVTQDSALALGNAVTAGDDIYGSKNAGGITKTKADLTSTTRVWHLGVATASGVINFNPTKGGIVP
jgi:hypothetical protein